MVCRHADTGGPELMTPVGVSAGEKGSVDARAHFSPERPCPVSGRLAALSCDHGARRVLVALLFGTGSVHNEVSV